MSLDNFQISSALVYELYKNSLVALDDEQLIQESFNSDKPSFLGNNSKRILILTDSATAIHLEDNELQLLIGILSACKLTLADVAVCNLNNCSASNIERLMEIFQPEKMISFGVNTEVSLPIPKVFFTIQTHNQIKCLASPSLQIISEDANLKKSLWISLKLLFEL